MVWLCNIKHIQLYSVSFCVQGFYITFTGFGGGKSLAHELYFGRVLPWQACGKQIARNRLLADKLIYGRNINFLRENLKYSGLVSYSLGCWGLYWTSDPLTSFTSSVLRWQVWASLMWLFLRWYWGSNSDFPVCSFNTVSTCYTLKWDVSNFINNHKVKATILRCRTNQKATKKLNTHNLITWQLLGYFGSILPILCVFAYMCVYIPNMTSLRYHIHWIISARWPKKPQEEIYMCVPSGRPRKHWRVGSKGLHPCGP